MLQHGVTWGGMAYYIHCDDMSAAINIGEVLWPKKIATLNTLY